MLSTAAVRFKCVPLTTFVTGLRQASHKSNSAFRSYYQIVAKLQTSAVNAARGQAPNIRSGAGTAVGRSWKDILTTPATDTPFAMGRLGLAIASGFGLGALCYYGLGLSSEVGTLDKAAFWPAHVQQRIHSTYGYLGGSLGITAASAMMVARNPRLMNFFMRNGWMAILGTFALMIGSGILCQSIPYTSGLGVKQLAWATHCGIMGGVIAPLTLMGGPLLVRAALYTAGVVGGLSIVALTAPSDKFLNMGGPLAMGFGVVFVASLGSMFMNPATAIGAGLYSISLYGGLILFSGFLLYDTQRVVKTAEIYPLYASRPFDPINACLGIYIDTLNIFIRIATLLAGGGRRK